MRILHCILVVSLCVTPVTFFFSTQDDKHVALDALGLAWNQMETENKGQYLNPTRDFSIWFSGCIFGLTGHTAPEWWRDAIDQAYISKKNELGFHPTQSHVPSILKAQLEFDGDTVIMKTISLSILLPKKLFDTLAEQQNDLAGYDEVFITESSTGGEYYLVFLPHSGSRFFVNCLTVKDNRLIWSTEVQGTNQKIGVAGDFHQVSITKSESSIVVWGTNARYCFFYLIKNNGELGISFSSESYERHWSERLLDK